MSEKRDLIEHNHLHGTEFFMKNREKHSEDGPAIINEAGEEWWVNGMRHRVDGPAICMRNGSKIWYQYNKYHRVDGPAVDLSNGLKEWWVEGKLHRLDGPAYEFGNLKEWWVEGKLHRFDGPARDLRVREEWWFEGKKHRVDGPAVTKLRFFGTEYYWYLFDVKYNYEEDFNVALSEYKQNLEDALYYDLKINRDLTKLIKEFTI